MPEKKLAYSAAVSIVAVLAVAGCSSSGGTGKSGTKALKISLITGHADGYYQALTCGAKREAKTLGATVSAQGPTEFAAAQQIPLIDAAVATKPAALIVVPTDATALVAPLTQAKSAGIKIVTTDTTLDTKGQSIVSSQISDDNAAGGVQAAKALAAAMNHTGKILVVSVAPGISTTDARSAGFAQQMKNYPGISLLPTQYDANDPTKASSIVSASLSAHPDIAGIYGTNNNTMDGVINGLQASGKAGKIAVTGWDGDPAEVAAVKAGTVNALIVSNPGIEGQYAVDQAVKAVKGQATTKSIASPLTVVTKATIGSSAAVKAIADYKYGPTTAC